MVALQILIFLSLSSYFYPFQNLRRNYVKRFRPLYISKLNRRGQDFMCGKTLAKEI